MSVRIFICAIALLLMPLFSQAAAVTPSALDLSASRGEAVRATFQIINTSTTEQTYYLETLGFSPREESGSPLFFSQKMDGLMQWIQFPVNPIHVPAYTKIDAPFLVVVPSDIASQSYYAAITVSSAPADLVETNGAVVEAKTAVLIFLTVNGDSIKKAGLLDFTTDATQGVRGSIKQTMHYRIQNQGNVYFIPKGSVKMKDLFGRTLIDVDANASEGRVLPNSTRKFDVMIGQELNGFKDQLVWQTQHLAVGPMQIELELNLGEGFDPIRSHMGFWYFPMYFIETLIGVIMIFLCAFNLIQKRFSKN